MRKRTAIALWAGAVVVLAGGWRLASRLRAKEDRASPAGQDTVSVGQEAARLMLAQRTRGRADAPITIFEFSDFQCPFCRAFWETTLPTLDRDYIGSGKVKLIFVNFPIAQIHPNAPAAHGFAMCSARQGTFWPVHDLLYRHQKEWEKLEDPKPVFYRLADSARLDRATLRACIDAKSEDWLVQGDEQAAWKAGVRSTPTFVINGGKLEGSYPIENWRPILDSIYRATKR